MAVIATARPSIDVVPAMLGANVLAVAPPVREPEVDEEPGQALAEPCAPSVRMPAIDHGRGETHFRLTSCRSAAGAYHRPQEEVAVHAPVRSTRE